MRGELGDSSFLQESELFALRETCRRPQAVSPALEMGKAAPNPSPLSRVLWAESAQDLEAEHALRSLSALLSWPPAG